MKMFWNASCVPEAAVRTKRSIGPRAVAPADSLQLCDPAGEDRLDLLLARGSRAWLLGLRDDADRVAGDLVEDDAAGVAGFGSREELPIVTRPRDTSVMPMSEPP